MQMHYLEIVTPEVDAVCMTYARLYDVTFSEPDSRLGGARTTELAGGGLIGVRAPLHESEVPVVRPYALVDDIEQAAGEAVEAGATLAHEPLELPGLGSFAIFDTGGVHHGLWQKPPARKMK